MNALNRYLLLFTGISLTAIGLAYCIDPNLLLSRYELGAVGASEDNMYRGAYGGLFIAVGGALCVGFASAAWKQGATVIAMLFMGGFAVGRLASIAAVGMPHERIFGLLIFAIATAALLTGAANIDGDADIVVILSGRNVDEDQFRDWIA